LAEKRQPWAGGRNPFGIHTAIESLQDVMVVEREKPNYPLFTTIFSPTPSLQENLDGLFMRL
jgi:hypothetical protein